jgi:hypothetical protein
MSRYKSVPCYWTYSNKLLPVYYSIYTVHGLLRKEFNKSTRWIGRLWPITAPIVVGVRIQIHDLSMHIIPNTDDNLCLGFILSWRSKFTIIVCFFGAFKSIFSLGNSCTFTELRKLMLYAALYVYLLYLHWKHFIYLSHKVQIFCVRLFKYVFANKPLENQKRPWRLFFSLEFYLIVPGTICVILPRTVVFCIHRKLDKACLIKFCPVYR